MEVCSYSCVYRRSHLYSLAIGAGIGLFIAFIGIPLGVTEFKGGSLHLFLSIPSAATAPALIIVGLLMAEQIRHVNFDYLSESIPAFICMITYVLMNMICGKFKKNKYTKS